MIVFECPSCKKKIQVTDEKAGVNGRCPNCKYPVTVPSNAPPPPSAQNSAEVKTHNPNLCSSCNSVLTEGAAFCSSCGTKILQNNVCQQCDNVLIPNSRFCRTCGCQTSNPSQQMQYGLPPRLNKDMYKNPEKLIFPDGKKRSPGLAVFLSFLLGGLGQIYLGQTNFGILLIVFEIVIGLGATLGLGYILAMIFSMIWAYQDAVKLNEGKPIMKWPGFGREAKLQ